MRQDQVNLNDDEKEDDEEKRSRKTLSTASRKMRKTIRKRKMTNLHFGSLEAS